VQETAGAVSETRERAPADLRLLPAAVGAEAGAALGLMLPGRFAVLLIAVALAAGFVGLVRAYRRPTAVLTALVALVLVFAGSLAGAAIRVDARQSGPAAEAAARNAPATLEVVLTGDPRRTAGSVQGDALRRESVVINARLERLTLAGRMVSIRQPVLLIAPAQGWSDLLPSQRVRLTGKLAAPRGSDLAAVVLVRGPPESVGPPSRWQRAAGGLRAGLRKACARLPDDARGLLPGLVVGDTTGMSNELTDDARAAGLSHLTAVSGANAR
jgi:competence protein ComEC